MDLRENMYCRFCAEPKSLEKLLNLQADGQRYEEVLVKLTFLNAQYVEVVTNNNLPKTVCFVCYDSLNKAYDFLDKVRKAQEVLTDLFSRNEENKYDLSDDDRMGGFDDFVSSEPVKEEKDTSELHNCQGNDVQISVEVKKEPKEESTEGNLSECINSGQRYEPSLDVQDIIDAAMCNTPLTSNIEIFEKDISELGKNVVKSWKDYPWMCSDCHIEFLDIDTLRLHAKAVHGKCAAFMCIDCKSVRKDNFSSFIKHVRKHRKALRNHCYYCNKKVDKTETVSMHIKQHHIQRSQLPCALCGEILKNEDALDTHLQEYSVVKPKRKPRRKPGTPITVEDLTCGLCKKVYKNPNSLRDHMKLHKIDRKRNYTCERCGKMFYNKGTLTSHIMSHDKIRPHVCRICNKSFLYPNMLRRHVEMHSGVKPFSCEQCGRCFRLQYQLNAHKIVHTDSMPYECQHCHKVFRYKQILKNHERQHTGAKPYSCQQCGMEFTNWSNYNKHMKRRHGTDTSKKKITPDGVFPVNSETGLIVQIQDVIAMEEWKSKIMIPAKRGKKKVIKQESNT